MQQGDSPMHSMTNKDIAKSACALLRVSLEVLVDTVMDKNKRPLFHNIGIYVEYHYRSFDCGTRGTRGLTVPSQPSQIQPQPIQPPIANMNNIVNITNATNPEGATITEFVPAQTDGSMIGELQKNTSYFGIVETSTKLETSMRTPTFDLSRKIQR